MAKKKTAAAPASSPATQEATPEDGARIAAFLKRESGRPKPPHFEVESGKGITVRPGAPNEKMDLFIEAVRHATGYGNDAVGADLIIQTAQALSPFEGRDAQDIQKALNETGAKLLETRPQDATEGMLAAQMVAAHSAALECMRQARLVDQTPYGRELNLKFADRFMRTYAAQVEALSKYRNKGAQKVTVEHVHVYPGGQAIVGTVDHAGRRAGGRGGHHD